MPCWQIRNYEVQAGKMAADQLIAALEALGWAPRRTGQVIRFQGGSYNLDTGVMTLPQGQDVATVKREYSRQVIATAAKRMGWQSTQNHADKNKYTIRRRT